MVFGKDLDDLFAYPTFKLVLVRDRRLGLLYYAMVIAVFVYVGVSIYNEQLYLQKEPVSGGSISFKVIQPTEYSPCSNCSYPILMHAAPRTQDASVFISTAISTSQGTFPQSCSQNVVQNTPNCMPTFPFSPSIPVANVINYTLQMEHSVKGFQTSVASSNTKMKGTLLKQSQATAIPGLTHPKPVKMYEIIPFNQKGEGMVRGENQVGDLIPIVDILTAAGINLNDYMTTGVSLIGFIEYSNRISNPEELKYTLTFALLESSAKLETTQYINGLYKITYNGISIRFVQRGTIGSFQFMALLTNLVASIALLSLAKLAVELIMLYVMPQKQQYFDYKYQKSEDFSDYRDRVEREKRERVSPE